MTAEFWGDDLTGALFRDVDLTDATITHAWMVNVEIDALVDGLVINGVDVTDYVNERDPWYPLRAMLRPADPAGMRATWDALEAEWATTLDTVAALPPDAATRSVNGEFSFIETVRHLVFAIDKWWSSPVLGLAFDSIGLPNSGSRDFPWPALQYDLSPTLDEALSVHAERRRAVSNSLATLQPADLERAVVVLENGDHVVRDCVYTVFEETFWHIRYARRDLAG